MHENTITFQLATNVLSKLSLRLECLFNIIGQACVESHEAIHRYALKSLIEIMDIIEKPELKSRFIKELIRIEHVFNKSNTGIDPFIYEKLIEQIHVLNHFPGSFNDLLIDESFLRSVRLMHQPNSQECEYNSPQLLMWLDIPAKQRQKDLAHWLMLLGALENTVSIYLTLLRSTTIFTEITAPNGFYQYALPQRVNCHLIQIKLDKNLFLVPKLQLGHNGLSIRLHKLNSLDCLHQSPVNLEIAVSQI